jgi:hypothetical protein
MKFKTVFLIVALAMLMLAGVAWAEDDDDQGGNDNFLFTCPDPDSTYLIGIDAPSSAYLTIADIFQEGGCEIVYNEVKVKSCIDDKCAKADGDGILASIAEFLEDDLPHILFVCAVCDANEIQEARRHLEEIPDVREEKIIPRKTN